MTQPVTPRTPLASPPHTHTDLLPHSSFALTSSHFRASYPLAWYEGTFSREICFHAYTFVLMLSSCPHTFMFMPSCSQGGLPSELTPPPHTHTDLLPHLFWLMWHNP